VKPFWKELLKQHVEKCVEGDNKIAQAFRDQFGQDVPITNAWRDTEHGRDMVAFTFEATMLNGVLVAADLVYPRCQTKEVELTAHSYDGNGGWTIWAGDADDNYAHMTNKDNFYSACLQVASRVIAQPEKKPGASFQEWLWGA